MVAAKVLDSFSTCRYPAQMADVSERAHADVVAGARMGQFLVLVDLDGLRHAVRVSSVLAASDADAGQDVTVLQLPAGRCILVRTSLEKVLAWLG